jgi:hypothetical protein
MKKPAKGEMPMPPKGMRKKPGMMMEEPVMPMKGGGKGKGKGKGKGCK